MISLLDRRPQSPKETPQWGLEESSFRPVCLVRKVVLLTSGLSRSVPAYLPVPRGTQTPTSRVVRPNVPSRVVHRVPPIAFLGSYPRMCRSNGRRRSSATRCRCVWSLGECHVVAEREPGDGRCVTDAPGPAPSPRPPVDFRRQGTPVLFLP